MKRSLRESGRRVVGSVRSSRPLIIMPPLSASITCIYDGLKNIPSSSLPVCVSTRVARTAAAQYLAVILVGSFQLPEMIIICSSSEGWAGCGTRFSSLMRASGVVVTIQPDLREVAARI